MAACRLTLPPSTEKQPEFQRWQDKVIELLSPVITNADTLRNTDVLYTAFNIGQTPEEYVAPMLRTVPEGQTAELTVSE